MVKIIFTTIVFGFIFVILLYESFQSIRKHDDSMAVICTIGAGLIGLCFGLLLGSLLF